MLSSEDLGSPVALGSAASASPDAPSADLAANSSSSAGVSSRAQRLLDMFRQRDDLAAQKEQSFDELMAGGGRGGQAAERGRGRRRAGAGGRAGQRRAALGEELVRRMEVTEDWKLLDADGSVVTPPGFSGMDLPVDYPSGGDSAPLPRMRFWEHGEDHWLGLEALENDPDLSPSLEHPLEAPGPAAEPAALLTARRSELMQELGIKDEAEFERYSRWAVANHQLDEAYKAELLEGMGGSDTLSPEQQEAELARIVSAYPPSGPGAAYLSGALEALRKNPTYTFTDKRALLLHATRELADAERMLAELQASGMDVVDRLVLGPGTRSPSLDQKKAGAGAPSPQQHKGAQQKAGAAKKG